MTRVGSHGVLVVVATAAALVLSACGSGRERPGGLRDAPVLGLRDAACVAEPSARPKDVEACASATKAAALYYLGDVPKVGPRLYREFAKVATCSDPISEALTSMFQVPPTDPDYTSLWPTTTTVLSVTHSRGVRRPSTCPTSSRSVPPSRPTSVQQLVWTATARGPDGAKDPAAGQRADPAVRALGLVAADRAGQRLRHPGPGLDPAAGPGGDRDVAGQDPGLRHGLRGQRPDQGLLRRHARRVDPRDDA